MAGQKPDLPWGAEEAEPRLDRAEIVRAALELLDSQGFEAFSMRKLATALDIKSPSLYWHVRDKEELFDLLIDTVIGTCRLPDDEDRPWAERLTALALDLRQVLLGRPAVTRLLPGRTLFGPNGLRLADHIIGTLRRAGFDNRLASYGYLILVYYIVGFATQETAFGKGTEGRARLTQINEQLRGLPAARYPDLVAVADDLVGPPGLTDRFELGLAGILDRLAHEHATTTAAQRPKPRANHRTRPGR
jgi:TetR/AcrR family tetracycline transcriptional repressor